MDRYSFKVSVIFPDPRMVVDVSRVNGQCLEDGRVTQPMGPKKGFGISGLELVLIREPGGATAKIRYSWICRRDRLTLYYYSRSFLCRRVIISVYNVKFTL